MQRSTNQVVMEHFSDLEPRLATLVNIRQLFLNFAGYFLLANVGKWLDVEMFYEKNFFH